jgi:hypothetical protein
MCISLHKKHGNINKYIDGHNKKMIYAYDGSCKSMIFPLWQDKSPEAKALKQWL